MNGWLANPRLLWLLLYLGINAACAAMMLDGRQLLGEAGGQDLVDVDTVLPLALVVALTYIGLQVVAFGWLRRVRVQPVRALVSDSGHRFGQCLLLLQLAFMAFFLTTGTFVAGSTTRSESLWSSFWVLVSVDSLFFLYYGFHRDSRLFWPNLAMAVASSLLRGWTGIFLLVAFMESCRWIRARRLSARKVLAVLVIAVSAYPVLYVTKLQVRLQALDADAGVSLVSLVQTALGELGADEYAALISASANQVLERLHLVSNTVLVYQERHKLAEAVERGDIQPFWKEGIYGIAYDRLSGSTASPNLGVALAETIDPQQTEVNWNANPGYGSWFLIRPLDAPAYLIYTLSLLFLAGLLVQRMGGGVQAWDMLWFASFSYLVPGWIASFVLFVHSLLLFYGLHLLLRWRAANNRPAPWAPGLTDPPMATARS